MDEWEPTPKELLIENLTRVEVNPIYGYFFKGKIGMVRHHNNDGWTIVHFDKIGRISFPTGMLRKWSKK